MLKIAQRDQYAVAAFNPVDYASMKAMIAAADDANATAKGKPIFDIADGEMAGASLSLLKLDNELEELMAAPAEIPIRVF